MGDVSRTITIKFTGQTKSLVTSVAEVDTALDTVGKQRSSLTQLSESMTKFETTVSETTKQTSKLTAFKNAVKSFSEGVQPLGSAGLGLAAVTTGVVALAKTGPFLAPLLGLLGLLPGAALIAAGAFGVLKLGSAGLAAAFKGVADNAKSQVSAVFQKEMAPAARNLKSLLDALVPSLKSVASEESSVAVALTKTAKSADNVKSLNTILGATHDVVKNVGAALAPLLTALLTIGSVAAPLFAQLTGSAGKWATELNAKVQEVARNGKLRQWIQDGINRFIDLKNGVVRAWNDIKPILEALAKQRFTLFGGVGSVIEPALKAIGNFLATHPDFAQWLVAGGLALKGFAAAMVIVNAAMDVNPVLLAIEAIALLALGLAALYKNNAGFKQWVDATWKGIQSVTNAFVTWWQQNVAPILAKGWELVVAAAQGAVQVFRDVIIPALKRLWADVGPVLAQAWQNLVDAWNVVQPLLKQVYDWIKDHWSEIKEAAKDYGEALAVVVGAVVIVLGLLVLAFAGAVKFITDQVNLGIFIFQAFQKAINDFAQFFARMVLAIGLQAQQLGQGIKNFLTDPWGSIQSAAQGALQWIQQQWNSLPGWFRDLASRIAGPFVTGFQVIVGGVRGAINEVIDLANTGINAVNGVTGAVGIPKIPNIPHLALGGPVQAGRPYIVGDGGGPEIFWPRQAGQVIGTKDTADLMSGGGGGFQGDMYLTLDLGEGITQRIQLSNRQLRAAVRAGR